jgi:hypothetical protein
MPGLLELQRSFAATLHGAPHDPEGWAAGDGIAAAARLRVYRNNSRASFEQALTATFEVVRARVGDDYFRQLAHFYRLAHPSRCGDLHEIGRDFPQFLEEHLAGTPYAWLAELAALEWAVAEAGVAPDSAIASIASLAEASPDTAHCIRLRLAPSLQRLRATVPVMTVWRSSRGSGDPSAVDLAAGPECVLVHRGGGGVQLRRVNVEEFDFVGAIARGATLAEAVDASNLPPDRLAPLLHALFEDGAVAEVVVPRGTSAERGTPSGPA